MDDGRSNGDRPAARRREDAATGAAHPRVARPGRPVEGSERAASILLFMFSFLLAPFGLTALLGLFPDSAPWWIPIGMMLALAGLIGLRKRAAGMGAATGTLVWIGVLVWITNFVN